LNFSFEYVSRACFLSGSSPGVVGELQTSKAIQYPKSFERGFEGYFHGGRDGLSQLTKTEPF
jgi:hypothetical protein